MPLFTRTDADIAELDDSPTYVLEADRGSGRRRFMVKWARLADFEATAFPVPFSANYLSVMPGFTALRAVRAEPKPFTNQAPANTDTATAYHLWAEVTVEYQATPLVRHRMQIGGEFLTYPSAALQWSQEAVKYALAPAAGEEEDPLYLTSFSAAADAATGESDLKVYRLSSPEFPPGAGQVVYMGGSSNADATEKGLVVSHRSSFDANVYAWNVGANVNLWVKDRISGVESQVDAALTDGVTAAARYFTFEFNQFNGLDILTGKPATVTDTGTVATEMVAVVGVRFFFNIQRVLVEVIRGYDPATLVVKVKRGALGTTSVTHAINTRFSVAGLPLSAVEAASAATTGQAYETALSRAVDATENTWVVTKFFVPNQRGLTASCDNETALVTGMVANRDGTTSLLVTRGTAGTTAATHEAAARVIVTNPTATAASSKYAVQDNVCAAVSIPTVEHTIEWLRVPSPPLAAIKALEGRVNAYTYAGIPPECGLFLGADIDNEVTSSGVTMYKLAYKITEKNNNPNNPDDPHGWNHFLRPSGDQAGTFQRICRRIILDADGNAPTTYLEADADAADFMLRVTSTAHPFPQAGCFIIKIDDELMQVERIAEVDDDELGFHVLRGVRGTTAADHTAAAMVVQVPGGVYDLGNFSGLAVTLP